MSQDASTVETAPREKAPLDELMLAMDVVDTLRHRERVLERVLSAEEQDRQMIERLREIYAGQGIEVSDDVLAQGVRALREERFVYAPTAPGFARLLAGIYVSRGRWGKPLALVIGLVAAMLVGYQTLVRGPELEAIAALPNELDTAYAAVDELTDLPQIEADAWAIHADAEQALGREDYAAARAGIAELGALRETLAREYELRIVSRPGELSGVWRVPDENPQAQNYYLIVEAIDADGERLTLPIVNEEDGRTYRVSRWGVRVDEATFRAVAADKRDDGIIQQAVLGTKRRGYLEPNYRPGVLGGAITVW